MSSASRSLSRLAIQFSRQTTAKRKPRYQKWRPPVIQPPSFSSAPSWLAEESNIPSNTPSNPPHESPKKESFQPTKEYITIEDLEDSARAEFDRSTPSEQEKWRAALLALSETDHTAPFTEELNAMDADINEEGDAINREAGVAFPVHKPTRNNVGFWADSEDDEFGQVFDDDNEFMGDDMTTPAHAQLDLHRDMREYQRRIAWDMPFLSKFTKPFRPPPQTTPLRFRYTTYLGEVHPSARKVVLQLSPPDLLNNRDPTTDQPTLTPAQISTLIKLAGVRYNPSTQTIKLSCEKFETPAQNKRYLGDLVARLIERARDEKGQGGGGFEDVPFDFRHVKQRAKVDFPEEWRLGGGEKDQERVRALVEGREKRRSGRLLREGEVGKGAAAAAAAAVVVDGDAIVKQYVEAVAAFQARRPNPSLVGPRAGGRGGGRQVVR